MLYLWKLFLMLFLNATCLSKCGSCLAYGKLWIIARLEAHFPDLLRILSDVLSGDDLRLMCWISWKLWLERNKNGGAVEKDPHGILDFTLAGFGEWKLLNPAAPLAIPESGSEVWETPLSSVFLS